MASPWSSGPVGVWVSVAPDVNVKSGASVSTPSVTSNVTGKVTQATIAGKAQGSPVFLGTCENGVTIRAIPEYENVMNDFGGTRKPFDRIYEGEDALSVGILTRWNEPVYRALESIPNFGGVPGVNQPGDIGTMMITEGYAYTVWLEFLFSSGRAGYTKAAWVAGGFPAGYRFPFSWLEGPKERETGTRAGKIHLTFYHGRGFDPVSGKFMCADQDMSLVSGVALN
jgi:hypothetical protein